MRVDQYTLVLPLVALERADAQLADLLGPAEPMRAGRHFYANGKRYACGAHLCWDNEGTTRPDSAVLVDLKAASVEGMGQVKAFELLALGFSLGGHVTRFDVALDFQDGRKLTSMVIAACERGELRGLRMFDPRRPRKWTGELLGESVYLGRRGKEGCGRFIRVYDKGLETGTLPAGVWDRWEVEFSGTVANDVAAEWIRAGDLHLVESDGREDALADRVADVLAARALGAVDFLEPGKRRDRAARVSWWSEFLAGVRPVMTRARRVASKLSGHVTWLRKQVVPTLQAMSEVACVPISRVLDLLVGGEVEPAPWCKPVVIEFACVSGSLARASEVLRKVGHQDGADRYRSWFNALRDQRQRDLDALVAAL